MAREGETVVDRKARIVRTLETLLSRAVECGEGVEKFGGGAYTDRLPARVKDGVLLAFGPQTPPTVRAFADDLRALLVAAENYAGALRDAKESDKPEARQ